MIFFCFFQSTSLRDSPLYLKYYSLIGSLIVMVLIPIIILITTCIYLRSAIPDGQHKEKISRIMIIIICMFMVAHVPKVKSEYSFLYYAPQCTIDKLFSISANTDNCRWIQFSYQLIPIKYRYKFSHIGWYQYR